MELTTEHIRSIAALARLSLTEMEVEMYRGQLAGVFAYMEILNEVKTDDVEPTAQVTGLVNVLRSDRVQESDAAVRNAIIQQFPERSGDALVVPPVL